MAAFITKRQQQALADLQHQEFLIDPFRPGCWFNYMTGSQRFSAYTVNTLMHEGWVGRSATDQGEVIALTPEGRKLARLLCGSR